MGDFLFSGKVEKGKLSNQEQIIENVPEEFVQGNKWYDHIQMLFITGVPVFNMGWRRKYEYNETLWDHMMACFQAMFGAQDARPEERIPACAWMLSVMLKEVPELPESVSEAEDHFYG